MNTLRVTTMVAFAFALVLASQIAQSNGTMVCNARYDIGQKWLATGTITKVVGTTFFLLGKDNQVYEINAAESQVYLDEEKINREAWTVGDTARVYGEVTNPCIISAERVRIFKRDDASAVIGNTTPGKEVSIVIEQEPTAPAGYGAGTEVQQGPQGNLCDWQGMVTNVRYGARGIDIQTSNGLFSVSIGDAPILEGNRRITLGLINIGDAVSVTGAISGSNQINAQRVEVTQPRHDSQNALPQLPASLVGVIQVIDYPSRTFRMQTSSTDIVVLVGPEACVQHNYERWSFMDLKPGQRIKMEGYGSLSSGYAAQFIMVIGVAP